MCAAIFSKMDQRRESGIWVLGGELEGEFERVAEGLQIEAVEAVNAGSGSGRGGRITPSSMPHS